jgi:hypothetical protein
MREIAEEMAETLKDPPSARFRNVSIIKTIGDGGKETISVCGELNAKNSYGAYGGLKTTVYWFSGDKIIFTRAQKDDEPLSRTVEHYELLIGLSKALEKP